MGKSVGGLVGSNVGFPEGVFVVGFLVGKNVGFIEGFCVG